MRDVVYGGHAAAAITAFVGFGGTGVGGAFGGSSLALGQSLAVGLPGAPRAGGSYTLTAPTAAPRYNPAGGQTANNGVGNAQGGAGNAIPPLDDNPGMCGFTGACLAQDAGGPRSGAQGAPNSGDTATRDPGTVGADVVATILPVPAPAKLNVGLKVLKWLKRFLRLEKAAAKVAPAAWKLGGFKSAEKWASQMAKRGWTPGQITEAVQKGERFAAENLVNKGNSATRFVHPQTGRSVVIDDVTQEVLHVGADGFKY